MSEVPPEADSRGRLLTGGENYREGNDRAPRAIDESTKHHPQSVREACRVLSPQADSLLATARTIEPSLRGNRVVFEATMLPNYLAGMYHPTDLINDLDIRSLGSRTSRRDLVTSKRTTPDVLTKTLILAASPVSLESLAAELRIGRRNPQRAVHGERLRQFDSLRLPSTAGLIRLPNGADEDRIWPNVWEVVLHPDPDSDGSAPLSQRTYEKFVALVSDLGGEVLSDWRERVDGMTFVPVELDVEDVDGLAAFNPLRSVSPMPRISTGPPQVLRRYEAPAPLAAPADMVPTQRPTILVFDGGVDGPSPYFDDYVNLFEATDQPPDADDQAHGTAVTAAILYGDIDPGSQLRSPSVNVDHYRVVPTDGEPTEMFELLDKITEIIEDLPPGQIVNLSVGPGYAMVDDMVHLWTIKLDELAVRKNCLFIVAAGNNGDDDALLGLNRIQPPADMVNGISVGACANRVRPGAVVERAPYSAVGPGRAGARIQPTGVAFGGSHQERFLCLAGDGRISYGWGTSYAAPLVTHGIGELAAESDLERSATLMRALAIHCAQAAGPHQDLGWGTFSRDYSEVLDYPRNEVTVVSDVAVTRDGLHTLPIAFPSKPVPGKIALKCTVVVKAPTEPREALDYTKVGLTVTLRPHAGRKAMTDPITGKKRIIDIVHDSATYRQLLRANWTESFHPESRGAAPASALELTRRELGGKWETVLKIEDSMLAKTLYRPRLDLDLISREGGAITRNGHDVKVSVVTTLVARADVDLYGLVVQEFARLSVLQARTRITT